MDLGVECAVGPWGHAMRQEARCLVAVETLVSYTTRRAIVSMRCRWRADDTLGAAVEDEDFQAMESASVGGV